MKVHLLAFILPASLLFACQSVREAYINFTKKPDIFTAEDGELFPKFIHDAFPKSKEFEKLVPNLATAKAGLRIIEIRRLNEKDEFFNESNLSWSMNGSYLSYEKIDIRNRQIQVQSLNGKFTKTLKMLPVNRAFNLNALSPNSLNSFNSGLSWSHDNHRYAFMSNGGIGTYRIYVGSIEGDEKIIANSSTKEGFASWNPRSNELAFISARSGNGDLYILPIGKLKPKRLTNSPDPELFPEWFPDGQGLLYSSGNSNGHRLEMVLRVNQTWSKPYALTDWGKDDIRPKISPCGKWVAFYSREISNKNTSDIWNLHIAKIRKSSYQKMDFENTVLEKNVVVDLNTGPAWSPDGQKIFYIKKDAARFNPIYMSDLSTGKKYLVPTKTKMNRDIMMSPLGVLSFRAQVGAWDKVYMALTNQGRNLQTPKPLESVMLKRPTPKYRLKRHSINSLDLRPIPRRIY